MSAENEALVRRFFEEFCNEGRGELAEELVSSGTHRGELMGIEPTGKSVSVEAISVFRIADGKIAEEWTVWDALGLMQQLGTVPAPA